MFHRREYRPPSPPVRTTEADLDEAARARAQSTRDFLEAVDNNLEIRQRTGRLRERRTMDHFTELLTQSVVMPKKGKP